MTQFSTHLQKKRNTTKDNREVSKKEKPRLHWKQIFIHLCDVKMGRHNQIPFKSFPLKFYIVWQPATDWEDHFLFKFLKIWTKFLIFYKNSLKSEQSCKFSNFSFYICFSSLNLWLQHLANVWEIFSKHLANNVWELFLKTFGQQRLWNIFFELSIFLGLLIIIT